MKHIILLLAALSVIACTDDTGMFNKRCIKELSLQKDSLTVNAKLAEKVWKEAPWSNGYAKNIFSEYVLPPGIADEPIEYYWREDIPEWLGIEHLQEEDMLALSRKINKRIDIPVKPEAWGNPQMGYTKTMAGNFGKCDDRAILLAMAMRAYGIPAAFEYVPNWGRKNNGHSFCTVIRQDDSVYVFQGRQDNGTDISFSDIPPKIYRRTFLKQNDNIISKRLGKESIPEQFKDCRFKDVTGFHNVSHRDINVGIDLKTDNKIAYLAVFTPEGWIPVAFGEICGNNAMFENVGTDILYLPCLYDENVLIPAASPIVVRKDTIIRIIPDGKRETITLTRKYPRTERIIRFAGYMDGGIFETANKADFSDASQIFRIDGIPLSRMQERKCRATGRYIRYRKPTGVFSIGEMRFYDKAGNVLQGKTMLPSGFEALPEKDNALDGNTLTYMEITGLTNVWIGIDFGKPVEIGKIEFCPRTDDNDISPNDDYELFYWNNRWISLGITHADDYHLTLSDIPSGALLWLRDITKGREERPFIYKDGRQMWL